MTLEPDPTGRRPFANRVIASLLTGELVEGTTAEQVRQLASHQLGIKIENDTDLRTVQWIIDRTLRLAFVGSPLSYAPAYPCTKDDVRTWVSGLGDDMRMHHQHQLLPLRRRLDEVPVFMLTDAFAILRDHPIALVDLVTFLRKLGDSGYCNDLIDHRALQGPLPLINYDKEAQTLAAFAQRASRERLIDWVESLTVHAYNLRLFVRLARAMQEATPGPEQLEPGFVLPHPLVITLLTRDRDRKEAKHARTGLPQAYIEFKPATQKA